jgi:hypothetical protein
VRLICVVANAQGLRTLVYAEKRLTEQECETFLEQYNEAATLMDGREEAVRVFLHYTTHTRHTHTHIHTHDTHTTDDIHGPNL